LKRFTEPFLIIFPICVTSRFLISIQIVLFSAHHLLATFTHKSSVTVADLRDYITRRKNTKISIVKIGKDACTRSRIRIGILVHVVKNTVD
jgi:hypothetical protein